jgi:hypothetical protein
MQEVAADRIVVGLDVDALAVVAAVVPVEQHRAERRHQPVGDVARAGRAVVVLLGQTAPSAETALRITSIGCAAAGIRSRISFTGSGNPRSATSFALYAFNSAAFGSFP